MPKNKKDKKAKKSKQAKKLKTVKKDKKLKQAKKPKQAKKKQKEGLDEERVAKKRCPDSEYSSDSAISTDDPFLGEKTLVYVDYLYLDQTICDRCQGTDRRVEQAIELLAPVMDMVGYTLELRRIEIANKELAAKHEFESSPTVRVNGVDICPEIIENLCDCCKELSNYDVYYRQFDFNNRLYEIPPTAYVALRILEIVFGHERPKEKIYKMPENIEGFLDAKAKKEREEAERKSAFVETAEKLGAGTDMAARIWAARPKHRLGQRSAIDTNTPGCCQEDAD